MTPELEARIIADSRDRVAWLRARARGITATDVAGLSGEASIIRAADAKLGHGPRFGGNAYTDHGRRREPEIAAWVAATHGILPSSALFRAEIEQRHLATPDGVTAWSWDAADLTRHDLGAGLHMMTARGVDAADEKTARFAGRFGTDDWFDLVTTATPEDDRSALLVRHEFETDTFATVLGQFIDSAPGELRLRYSRTPWRADGWTERAFRS